MPTDKKGPVSRRRRRICYCGHARDHHVPEEDFGDEIWCQLCWTSSKPVYQARHAFSWRGAYQ